MSVDDANDKPHSRFGPTLILAPLAVASIVGVAWLLSGLDNSETVEMSDSDVDDYGDITEEECVEIQNRRMFNHQAIKAWENYKKLLTDPSEIASIDKKIADLRAEIVAYDKILAVCFDKYPHLKPQ